MIEKSGETNCSACESEDVVSQSHMSICTMGQTQRNNTNKEFRVNIKGRGSKLLVPLDIMENL